MRRYFKMAAILAIISSPAAATEQASSMCLTGPEANALFIYSIPEVLDGVTKSCKATLPSTAFLATKSDETIARFRASANGSWPAAKVAFLKIVGPGEDNKVIAQMPDSALQPFVAAALSGVIAKEIKPADCPKIDRFVAALAPIPPSNVAELLTALMSLVGQKESDNFKVC
jgi:hypothetical protein